MNEYWSDIASALEDVLDTEPVNMRGLRAMIVQAIVELRALKQANEIKANPTVLEMLSSNCLGCVDRNQGKPFSWARPHSCADESV